MKMRVRTVKLNNKLNDELDLLGIPRKYVMRKRAHTGGTTISSKFAKKKVTELPIFSN